MDGVEDGMSTDWCVCSIIDCAKQRGKVWLRLAGPASVLKLQVSDFADAFRAGSK